MKNYNLRNLFKNQPSTFVKNEDGDFNIFFTLKKFGFSLAPRPDFVIEMKFDM